MARTRLQRRDLGEKFTEGARQTWIAIDKKAWDHATLAEELGVAQGTVHKILYGDRLPDGLVMIRLEQLLKIPCKLWATAPKNHFTPPAARAA